MKAYFQKTQLGLAPADPPTEEWFHKLKPGEVVKAEFKKVRNYRFLKKWFALLNVGFETWTPGEIDSKYGMPEKNFDRFRADVTILAGYFDVTIRLDGSTRIEPKSVSFANMTEEDFEKLYSRTIDVLIKHIYDTNMTAEDLSKIVDQYLQFA